MAEVVGAPALLKAGEDRCRDEPLVEGRTGLNGEAPALRDLALPSTDGLALRSTVETQANPISSRSHAPL